MNDNTENVIAMRRLLLFLFVLACLYMTTFGVRLKPAYVPPPESMPLAHVLREHVRFLSSEIGDRNIFMPVNLSRAREYIVEQFRSCGYEPELQEVISHDRSAYNIIATKIGTLRPQEVVIIGAHYDTCFNPGADDNASGIAVLLELARKHAHLASGRTVKFIAFVNEEPPFFKSESMGSHVYARNAKATGEDIRAVVILEMVGYFSNTAGAQCYPPLLGLIYPNTPNFVAVVSNLKSRSLKHQIISIFRKNSSLAIEGIVAPSLVPGVDFSDHWSFWKDGYPAVMVTDTAFYRYAHYHQRSDTFEKLDYNAMAALEEGLSVVIESLSQ